MKAPAKRGPGRPKAAPGKLRDRAIHVRCSDEEYERWRAAGVDLSSVARSAWNMVAKYQETYPAAAEHLRARTRKA